MMKKHKVDYLIVGNSAGGIGAAEAIREVDKEGSITILSEESYHTYSRPLISKYLTGERDMNGILFRPADFYDAHAITLIKEAKVEHLHPQEHMATLSTGEEIVWKKAILAWNLHWSVSFLSSRFFSTSQTERCWIHWFSPELDKPFRHLHCHTNPIFLNKKTGQFLPALIWPCLW